MELETLIREADALKEQLEKNMGQILQVEAQKELLSMPDVVVMFRYKEGPLNELQLPNELMNRLKDLMLKLLDEKVVENRQQLEKLLKREKVQAEEKAAQPKETKERKQAADLSEAELKRLYLDQHMSVKDIAAMTGLTVSALYKRIERIKEKARKEGL